MMLVQSVPTRVTATNHRLMACAEAIPCNPRHGFLDASVD